MHPAQLYEAVGLAVLGWWLFRSRRRGVPDAVVLGRYLIGAGGLRFIIEFIRVNERVAFGLSVAHLVSLAAIVLGAALLGSQPVRRPARAERTRS